MARFIRWLMSSPPRTCKAETWEEISLVLADDKGISMANGRYLGKEEPTDVISFRYDPLPGERTGRCGEIIVNVERAVQIGTSARKSSRELALYIAHGCDHLMGGTDDTRAGYLKMRRWELRRLRQAEAADCVERLVSRPRRESRRSAPGVRSSGLSR